LQHVKMQQGKQCQCHQTLNKGISALLEAAASTINSTVPHIRHSPGRCSSLLSLHTSSTY
jgi:hypothetical protein